MFSIPGFSTKNIDEDGEQGDSRRDRSRSRSLSNSSGIFGATDDAAILNRKSRSSSLRESLKGLGDNIKRGANWIPIRLPGGASVVDGTQKQMLLSMMHTLLDNLRLQCPLSHTGVLVAFSTETMHPLSQSGITFIWFRTGGHDSSEFTQVQKGFRPYYSPSCDDIGHRICLQCQDTFGEGYSRYIESDSPIVADKLLTGIAESAVKCGYFTTHKVRNVSVGTMEKVHMEERGDTVKEAGDGDNSHDTYEASIKSESTEDLMTERSSSALFEGGDKYLLLDDTHTAHVSEKGLFFGTRRPLTEGATGADIAVDGIRLVPSKKISVTCSSPCAAVVSISLEHDLKGTETDKDGVDEEETSWRALAPWKRESLTFDADTGAVPVTSRHAAAEEIALEGVTNEDEDILYSENEPKPEEEARARKMDETLLGFLARLDRDDSSIKICFVFDDRVYRDAFVLLVRCMVCEGGDDDSHGEDAEDTKSEEERQEERQRKHLRSLPWVDGTTGKRVEDAVSQVSAATVEMGHRLNHLELENVVLKKERIDLTMRLLALEKDPALPSAAPIITTEAAEGPPVPVPASTPTMELSSLSSNVSELYAQMMVHKTSREKAVEKAREAEQRSAALSLELAKSQERCQSLASHQRRAEEDISSMRSELQAAHGGVAELKMQLVKQREVEARQEEVIRALEQKARDTTRKITDATARVVSVEVEVQEKEQEIVRLEGALQEQAAAMESKETLCAQLEVQVMAGLKTKMQQETEIGVLQTNLSKMKIAAEGRVKAEEEAKQAQLDADKFHAQANVEKKRGEGLAKELKRLVKENNLAIQEFERALSRKSEENNMLYEKVRLYEGSAEGSVASNDGVDVGDGLGITAAADSVKRFTSGALDQLGSFGRRGSGSKGSSSANVKTSISPSSSTASLNESTEKQRGDN